MQDDTIPGAFARSMTQSAHHDDHKACNLPAKLRVEDGKVEQSCATHLRNAHVRHLPVRL